MPRQTFIITYTFVSSSAEGDDYTRTLTISARSHKEADHHARDAGFKAFGWRFSDNCIDWRVSPLQASARNW